MKCKPADETEDSASWNSNDLWQMPNKHPDQFLNSNPQKKQSLIKVFRYQ
jgi:hypothetical protein